MLLCIDSLTRPIVSFPIPSCLLSIAQKIAPISWPWHAVSSSVWCCVWLGLRIIYQILFTIKAWQKGSKGHIWGKQYHLHSCSLKIMVDGTIRSLHLEVFVHFLHLKVSPCRHTIHEKLANGRFCTFSMFLGHLAALRSVSFNPVSTCLAQWRLCFFMQVAWQSKTHVNNQAPLLFRVCSVDQTCLVSFAHNWQNCAPLQ